MIRFAIFDCDGTLVDSQANVCRAMEMRSTTPRCRSCRGPRDIAGGLAPPG